MNDQNKVWALIICFIFAGFMSLTGEANAYKPKTPHRDPEPKGTVTEMMDKTIEYWENIQRDCDKSYQALVMMHCDFMVSCSAWAIENWPLLSSETKESIEKYENRLGVARTPLIAGSMHKIFKKHWKRCNGWKDGEDGN